LTELDRVASVEPQQLAQLQPEAKVNVCRDS